MEPVVGGLHEVEGSQNSLEYDDLARFAVDEHNKENANVEFQKVVNVKTQVVARIKYYITLEATDGGQKKVYEAIVWVKPWMKFKKLKKFKLIGDAYCSKFALQSRFN